MPARGAVTFEFFSNCLRRLQGGAGLGLLCLHVSDFLLRVAALQLLLQKMHIGIGHTQAGSWRCIHLRLRGGARLKQPLHRRQGSVRGIAIGLGLDQSVARGQHFFLRASALLRH